MPKLGSHMSIAGGYWKAVEAAAAVGCDCVQLFTKNSNQWAAKPITDEDVRLFRDALSNFGIVDPVSHASYLINLASPNEELRTKSRTALVVELERAAVLGIPHVIVHPGSFTDSSEEAGLSHIAREIRLALDQTKSKPVGLLLENTAGQGSNLGWKFEHLGAILRGLEFDARIGACFDTCHAFAAGYDLTREDEFESMWREFDHFIGLDRLKAIHLNDCKKELGCRVDRHEHIGLGKIGRWAFSKLMHDARFASVPMYLETEKGTNDAGEDWDIVNLQVLRSL